MDRFLENDTILKILSVLVAIAFWVQVSASNLQQTQNTIGPVTVVWSLPANKNLNVTSLSPNAVQLRIQGQPKAVTQAKASEMTALVSLNHVTRPGTYHLPVVASVPAGTTLVSVTPKEIWVTVDQTVTRKMPITVKTMGNPANKYQLVKVTPSQTTASVTGPSNQLSQVTGLLAEVPIGGRDASFQEQIIVVPVDKNGQMVSHVEVNPPMINVSADIEPIPPHKQVQVVVRLKGAPAKGYRVQSIHVSPNTITITGAQSALDAIKTIYTMPIDVTGDTTNITQLVPLVLPSGVSSKLDRATVTIAIQK